jgi:hypothetical protein
MPRSSNWFIYFRFSHWNPVCICLILLSATCPDSFILFDLITWMIFGQEYKSWRSSRCSFLQPPIISYRTFSLRSSLYARGQFHTYTHQKWLNYGCLSNIIMSDKPLPSCHLTCTVQGCIPPLFMLCLTLALRNPFQSSPWQHSPIHVSQVWSHVT